MLPPVCTNDAHRDLYSAPPTPWQKSTARSKCLDALTEIARDHRLSLRPHEVPGFRLIQSTRSRIQSHPALSLRFCARESVREPSLSFRYFPKNNRLPATARHSGFIGTQGFRIAVDYLNPNGTYCVWRTFQWRAVALW